MGERPEDRMTLSGPIALMSSRELADSVTEGREWGKYFWEVRQQTRPQSERRYTKACLDFAAVSEQTGLLLAEQERRREAEESAERQAT